MHTTLEWVQYMCDKFRYIAIIDADRQHVRFYPQQKEDECVLIIGI